MDAAALLVELHMLGATVRLDDGDVRVRAPRGVLTPELVHELRAHKPAVLALLMETEAGIAWRIEAFGDALLAEEAAAGELGVCAWCGSPMPPQPGRKCTRCCLASAALLDRRRIMENDERRWPDLPIALIVVTPGKRGQAVVVACPFCGDVHHHGHMPRDPTKPGQSFGMRVSHCLVDGRGTYELVIAPAGTPVPRPLRIRYDRDGRMRLVPRKPARSDAA